MSQVNIGVLLDNQEDSVLYLMKYKSDKTQIIIDTSSISYGRKTFRQKNNYEEGIYVLANSRQQPLFEILIGKDQIFSINVAELMDYNSYKIKGSKETASYFDIYSKTIHDKLYVKALESEIKFNKDNIRKIDSVKRQLYDYQESKLNNGKNLFLNTYIKYIEEVMLPEDYMENENYIAEHYFDELPLCDLRVLNSRLLKNKLDDYFDNRMSSQAPDKICGYIDSLINKTNDCKEIRDYILWYLYAKYFNPKKIENEFVYIHLVDKYFSDLEMKNLTEDIRRQIVKRADVLRKVTIGETAPTLSYLDENEDIINLCEISAKNIVLFFYKPDCQKCIRDKRILENIKKRNEDLTILYINISEDNHNNVSQDIVNQYDVSTTPTIYILDANKEIIAKRIETEQIEFYIHKK